MIGDGTLWCWGPNDSSQIGDETIGAFHKSTPVLRREASRLVVVLQLTKPLFDFIYGMRAALLRLELTETRLELVLNERFRV